MKTGETVNCRNVDYEHVMKTGEKKLNCNKVSLTIAGDEDR